MLATAFATITARNSGRNSPLLQGCFWALVALFALPAVALFAESPEFLWAVGAAILLSYSIFNALIGLVSLVWGRYLLWSILSYVLLAGIMVLYITLLSSTAIGELMEYKLVYLALFVSYFLIVGVTSIIRGIASYLKVDLPPSGE